MDVDEGLDGATADAMNRAAFMAERRIRDAATLNAATMDIYRHSGEAQVLLCQGLARDFIGVTDVVVDFMLCSSLVQPEAVEIIALTMQSSDACWQAHLQSVADNGKPVIINCLNGIISIIIKWGTPGHHGRLEMAGVGLVLVEVVEKWAIDGLLDDSLELVTATVSAAIHQTRGPARGVLQEMFSLLPVPDSYPESYGDAGGA